MIQKNHIKQKIITTKVLLNFGHLQKFVSSKLMNKGQRKYFPIWPNNENVLCKSFYL